MICRVTHSSANDAHRLVQPDQSLLNQVVASAADQEVRAGLQSHERRVPTYQRVESRGAAVARFQDQLKIL